MVVNYTMILFMCTYFIGSNYTLGEQTGPQLHEILLEVDSLAMLPV